MAKVIKKDNLRKIYDEIKDLNLELRLAGLSILVRDTADFLNTRGLQDAHSEEFRSVYALMLNKDRYYWSNLGPDLYRGLKEAGYPSGFAESAYFENFDLKKLTKNEYTRPDGSKITIVQEWTRFPGWFFFKTYTALTKDRILAGSTVEQERKKVLASKDKFEIIEEYVHRLTENSTLGKKFWYPVMLYISLLVVESFFETF